ncbi:hypothetical protein M0804_005878 [Polistes exclamans]|nr:hypothetical protein M0804_005878 [Polistes exclamans]
MSNASPSRGFVNGEKNELGAAAATAAPSVFPGRSGGGDAADTVFNGGGGGGGSGGGGADGGDDSGTGRGVGRGEGNEGYVVTVSTEEGVVGVVDLHDASLDPRTTPLKSRLERIDRRVNLQKLRSESSENSILSEHIGACSPPNLNSVTVPSTSDIHKSIQSESSNTQYNESFKIRLNTSGGITTVKQECNDNQIKHEKQEISNESRLEWEEKKKRRSDPTPLTVGIKRKRGVSCSSTISNDTTSMVQDKQLSHESSRKGDSRKGKSLIRKESFLTTEEHYYTAVGDPNYTLSLKESSPSDINATLEVPNWRVKVYTSCYTMEGTENLDDEIFNKRHLKLENDERRRKRWDVQRIREQRHIEKLKQRQERQNHQATCYNTNHTGPCPSTMEEETVTSLWPDVEQIQSLQVDHQLPVTAFGAPIPSFTSSEFSLPWTHVVRTKSRCPKRSTGRRKTSRR